MSRPHDRYCPHQGSANLKRSPVISSSYRNRLNRITHTTSAPLHACDYEVTGAIAPDATGDYLEYGTHEGQTTYEREDAQWYIWFQIVLPGVIWKWNISAAVNDLSGVYWNYYCGPVDPPPGDYGARNGANGIATVQLP